MGRAPRGTVPAIDIKEEMVYCTSCGADLASNRFCTQCGDPRPGPPGANLSTVGSEPQDSLQPAMSLGGPARVAAQGWQPPQSQHERDRLAKTMARAARRSVSVDQMVELLASVGIHSEADMDAAQKWNESYIDGLSAFGTLVHALNFISWRFSFLGLFWLAVGLFAIFVGTSEFGFLGLVVGVVVIAYAAYLFAGGRTRFFVF